VPSRQPQTHGGLVLDLPVVPDNCHGWTADQSTGFQSVRQDFHELASGAQVMGREEKERQVRRSPQGIERWLTNFVHRSGGRGVRRKCSGKRHGWAPNQRDGRLLFKYGADARSLQGTATSIARPSRKPESSPAGGNSADRTEV